MSEFDSGKLLEDLFFKKQVYTSIKESSPIRSIVDEISRVEATHLQCKGILFISAIIQKSCCCLSRLDLVATMLCAVLFKDKPGCWTAMINWCRYCWTGKRYKLQKKHGNQKCNG